MKRRERTFSANCSRALVGGFSQDAVDDVSAGARACEIVDPAVGSCTLGNTVVEGLHMGVTRFTGLQMIRHFYL